MFKKLMMKKQAAKQAYMLLRALLSRYGFILRDYITIVTRIHYARARTTAFHIPYARTQRWQKNPSYNRASVRF